METSVFKIENDNLNRKRYLNVMNAWSKRADYKLSKDSLIYAIAFGDCVQAGASVSVLDDIINIALFNNSVNHQGIINEEATTQLYDLIDEEYGNRAKVIKYFCVK